MGLFSAPKSKVNASDEVIARINGKLNELEAELAAINSAHATIEFSPDGKILDANEHFLSSMGYSLSEIKGQQHSIFVDADYARSDDYRSFWAELRRGQAQVREFKRIAKGGREVWITGSYLPILNEGGAVVKVVKHCTDVTQEVSRRHNEKAQLDAINRSQAVISFSLDGTILHANDNFLKAVGYTLAEIRGQHHQIFMDPSERDSEDYRNFWKALGRGEFQSGEFKRISKKRQEIWIQASYNPILDTNGKPVSVVKFASDITSQVLLRNKAIQVGDMVAESSNQMASTIAEISENVNRTAGLASSAEAMAKTTNQMVCQLDESSRVIGQVVEVIRALADQTNLLSLNATIESARAGEAGRGFAIVAHEIKGLARQTADATKNIEESVNEIQSNISRVVSSTTNITQSVSDVNVNMTTIAAAVEEQSGTMRSLSETASQLR